jgi:hypothetical protein
MLLVRELAAEAEAEVMEVSRKADFLTTIFFRISIKI